MKVLQLGKFYPVRGGVEKVMELLRDTLPTRGIDCDLLCSSYDAGPSKEVAHIDGGTTFISKTLFRKFGTTFSPQLLSKLREIQGHYDLIHIHHPDPMAGWVLKHSGYQGKVVLHWHSDVLVRPWLYKMYQPIEDWLLQRADKVVGTTPIYVAESPQVARGLRDRSKLTYLPIGIPDKHPNAALVQKIQAKYKGKRLLLTIGRLVPYKGIEYLIDMASHLSDDYVVLIAGRGPLEQKLQQQIEAEGLTNKVKLLGFITDEEKVAYLEACHLFVLSSITKNEAFAIVQVEAMSHRKPVVSTQIPESGVAWVNKDHDSGRTVPVRDGEALARAVEEICSSEAGYQAYADRARARFESLFTIDAMTDRCVEIYQEVLKQ
ncbi:glycosyltransferase [uncultured Porphyromonas sp.]|uniref:glycosyltransferase n=1 Tax=uncultured Porphyromonas sp. TaxID=159274 RepID=UPI002589A9B0|nr:glycosyltransferase [uncultured Porphyromonas sp.]